MRACGIIVDYNPFHPGHLFHLTQVNKITHCDIIIALMPSFFSQKGHPMCFSKEIRTKWALANGVNLIVEIPYIYTVQTPDIFANAAFQILNDLQVQFFVTGSESGPTEKFIEKYNSKSFNPPRLDDIIQNIDQANMSYIEKKQRACAVIEDYYLETSSDILTNAFYKVVDNNNFSIKTIIIPRQCHLNPQQDYEFSSSYVRTLLTHTSELSSLPINYPISSLHRFDDYFPFLKYQLLTMSDEQLEAVYLMDDGLAHLFKKQIKTSSSITDFIHKSSSKRFSGAYISRAIIHILNNTAKNHAQQTLLHKPPYIRILGMDSVGQQYLAEIRKSCPTPILNRFQVHDFPLLADELKANSIFFAPNNLSLQVEEYQKERRIYPILKR